MCNYYVLLLAVHFAFTREYISMAQARNILGFGGYQAHTKKDTKGGDMECAFGRERGCVSENVRISPAATTLGFLRKWAGS